MMRSLSCDHNCLSYLYPIPTYYLPLLCLIPQPFMFDSDWLCHNCEVRSLVEGDILSRNVRQVDSNDTVSYHRKGVISRQMTIWVQLMSQPGIEIKAISMTLLSIQIHSLDFIYELPSIMNHSHCHCIGFRGCNSLGSEGEVLARRSQFIHGLGPSTWFLP